MFPLLILPPPRNPRNLFFRNSLIFLFLIVAVVSCDMPNPGPQDQTAPTPELSVRVTPQTPIVEGDSATVSITMTPPPSSNTPVNFTIGGEGITPADYTITMEDGTELSESDGVIAVTIPANVPTVLLTITMANDSDGAETLAFTVQDSANGQYTLKAMGSSVNIPIAVRLPSARYDATGGVLTLTEIDLMDVPGADNVDMSKLSIVGKGGTASAIPLTATPTIAKVNEGEFHLTLTIADRKSILDVLDSNGSSASDSMEYSIALADNWNGASSSAHASIPVRTTNFPPGYCGYPHSDPTTRPTIDGTANDFFGGGTGTEDNPYSITMRLYCDDLRFDWNNNYPANPGITHEIYYSISFTTAGSYNSSYYRVEMVPSADGLHTFYGMGIGVDSMTPKVFFAGDSPTPSGVALSTSVQTTTDLAEILYYGQEGTSLGGAIGFRFQLRDEM